MLRNSQAIIHQRVILSCCICPFFRPVRPIFPICPLLRPTFGSKPLEVMRDIHLFRRYELIFVLTSVIVYVIRRLFSELDRLNDMIELVQLNGIRSADVWRSLANYDHTVNNNVPLIAGAILMVGAWYIVHALAFPRISDLFDDKRGWLYVGLAIVLMLTSVFTYHYLKLYVRYRMDVVGRPIGLYVFSLYRKRTVLADAIGFGILICTYELALQYYHYVTRRVVQESQQQFRLLSLFLLCFISLGVFSFALNGYLPPTLWQYGLQGTLLILGFGLTVFLLQGYIYSFIIPIIQTPGTSENRLFVSIFTFLMAGLLATLIVLGAGSGFYFRSYALILSLTALVWVASIAVAYGRKVLSKEKTQLQTQVSATSAELASLRAQINPHFLFNALNSLYATALKENSEKTADGIQKLGDMMRFMLQENNHDQIPLDKEIEYLRNYIQIQQMRIDETQGVDIRVTIQEPGRAMSIAPMMLTPFVENAFKHGISFRHPSWIYITLTLDNTRLYFKVHNSRHAKATNNPEESQSGVGLENVRKRLELIYPNRYELAIQQSDQDYFVSLTLE